MNNIAPTDYLVFLIVVGLRFLLPLFIPYFPLPAIIACLLLDGVDQTIFQVFTTLPLDGYQSYDKALDIYYLTVAYIATLRNWTNLFAFRVSRFLLYYRLVGVVLFELTQLRALLLIFPNTFEYFFIWYETVRLWWDPKKLSRRTVFIAAAAIWIVIKLPQEYWIHIARLDLTDVLKTALFGASPQTPWGHIFRAAPWLFVGVAALGAGVIVVLAWLAGRGHPPAGRPTAAGQRWPGHAPPPDHEALRAARAAWAARVVDRDMAEKLLLVSLLTAVFAQMLPGTRPATPLVVLGAAVVVALNTALSHALARRGVGWTNALGQFLVMLGANFTAVFLYRALPGTRDLDEAAVLFFVLLLSVIVTLFDRFQIVQRARQADSRG